MSGRELGENTCKAVLFRQACNLDLGPWLRLAKSSFLLLVSGVVVKDAEVKDSSGNLTDDGRYYHSASFPRWKSGRKQQCVVVFR